MSEPDVPLDPQPPLQESDLAAAVVAGASLTGTVVTIVNPSAYQAVAGLGVPLPLVPRIIAAFRGTYPTLTTMPDDQAAVRSVLKYLVTSILSSWESTQAMAPVDDAMAAVQADYVKQAEKARAKAQTDAGKIIGA